MCFGWRRHILFCAVNKNVIIKIKLTKNNNNKNTLGQGPPLLRGAEKSVFLFMNRLRGRIFVSSFFVSPAPEISSTEPRDRRDEEDEKMHDLEQG